MKSKPIVSVILPVYNEEENLKRAILSIEKQSYKNWELIIINDGSTDQTLSICKKFIKKNPKIKLINNSKNLGIVRSLNLGIETAKGKFIARQDADDLSYQERLKLQVEFLEKNKNYGLVSSLFSISTKKQEILKVTALPLDDYEIKLGMLFFNPMTHGSVMFRKNILKKFNLRYEQKDLFCEDYALWARMSANNKFAILDQVLYQWTISKDGITSKNLALMEKKRKELSQNIKIDIDIKRIKETSKKYKNKNRSWTHKSKTYLIDFCKMYQKILFNTSKIIFKQKDYPKAFKILIISFFMSPGNYFDYIQKKILLKKTNQLELENIINNL